jgi:succinyl-diaminopimelate desuccinylase
MKIGPATMAPPRALPDPVLLTQQLVRLDSINPPGSEGACAELLGALLADAGFEVRYAELSPGRLGVVATIGDDTRKPRLAFTGHLDTVPLGNAPWTVDPFGAELKDGRLHGRGASDMKSGVAAFVVAALRCAPALRATPGIALILTAGEETGCDGARQLVQAGALPDRVGALVVGEPTSNRPMLGHKGALWLRACTHGKTAHGAMPELGDNAIYKMARVVRALEQYGFGEPHNFFGRATLNVGTIQGGLNVNSVPDRAAIEIDIRTLPRMDHSEVREALARHLGHAAELQPLLDAPGVLTDASHPWVGRVLRAAGAASPGAGTRPGSVAYFTDASVLKPALGDVPTVILGPGEAHMAHQTDEYALVERIDEAAALYQALMHDWCGIPSLPDASNPAFAIPPQPRGAST